MTGSLISGLVDWWIGGLVCWWNGELVDSFRELEPADF